MDTDGMQFANPIDELTYVYDNNNKNLLLSVSDATTNPQGFKDSINRGDDYTYDANGNMTRDDNKGITNITYNHLNLPVIIYFADDNKITYLYNATGQKLNKKVIQTGVTTTTDYLSGFQYKKKTASEPVVLQFFPHAEGYVNATQNELIGGGTSYTFNYVYNYTDHLGNIRLSYSQDPSTNVLKVIEENHYYPFGLKHTGYNSDKMMLVKEASILKIKPVPPLFKTSYDKKFNGKSWETDLSLNVYDFHARGYMPDIVRTFQQDPLAEKFYSISPHSFLNNNPLYFIDPDGMLSQSFIDDMWNKSGDGETKWTNNNNGSFTNDNGDSVDANDEPPVNFFKPTSKQANQKRFNDVFNEMNKKENYNNGDGIFSVYGHGSPYHIGDNKGSAGQIYDADEFEKVMSERSQAYSDRVKKNQSFTLFLYSCESGTEFDGNDNMSMARKISSAHPKATVYGFDGYVMYGRVKGKASIEGISKSFDRNDNKGYIVKFVNGEEISRMLYTEYIKLKNE